MKYSKDLEPVIDLWARVIKKAIDDLIFFSSHASDLERDLYDSA